jgi:uncharacterized protein YlxW (UPF0749 family)
MLTGGQLMVVLIVAIVTIASIIKSKNGNESYRRRGRQGNEEAAVESPETIRLRDEVKQLKERLAVLERITVEKENSLEREIERLRDK